MKTGTAVKWTTASGVNGSGVVLTDEEDSSNDFGVPGHVLVAVDAAPGEEHRVIFCTVTWLTPMEG